MTPENKKSKRLMGVCLLGCILLNYPILSLFNRPTLFFGIPALYFYMFAAWAVLIALIYLVTRSRRRPSARQPTSQPEDSDA